MNEPVKKSKRWTQRVTQRSNALDLERGVFSTDDPKSIAQSLKRSADTSDRRKTDSFRSAMSMLTFYINRAGKNCQRIAAPNWKRQKTNCVRSIKSRPDQTSRSE